MYDFLSFQILRVLKRLLFFFGFLILNMVLVTVCRYFSFFFSNVYKDILGFILHKTETVFFLIYLIKKMILNQFFGGNFNLLKNFIIIKKIIKKFLKIQYSFFFWEFLIIS